MRSTTIPRAVIVACPGQELQPDQAAFFSEYNPLGFILFGHNCKNREQIRRLTRDLRACVGRADAPILIDQEGGTVSRLPPEAGAFSASSLAMRVFGRLYEQSPERAEEAVYLNFRLIADELRDLGITVNCAPVLDLQFPYTHDVIGSRAFSHDPHCVIRLGRAAINGMMEGGIIPVIKHIPGHGRARADSHKELPKVKASRDELGRSDFLPFEALSDTPWAMSAHILYKALDRRHVSTVSPVVISQIIRERIGFRGILISDDIAMSALKGSMVERARNTLKAGCDLVLYCHGNIQALKEVVEIMLPLSDATLKRLAHGHHCLCEAAKNVSLTRDQLQERWQNMKPFLRETQDDE